MSSKAAPFRPRGVSANARRILRELILIALAEMDGQARASSVLQTVRERAEGLVPGEWQKPHPPYRTRVDLYTAFERATLRDLGLIDGTERGYWKLTLAGWGQAKKVAKAWKNGTAKPTASSEQVLWQGDAGWIGRILGSMRDEPDFSEVVRLGRKIRSEDRPA